VPPETKNLSIQTSHNVHSRPFGFAGADSTSKRESQSYVYAKFELFLAAFR